METGLAEWVATRSVRQPVFVLALWAAVALASTAGVARLRVETSTDSVLNRSNSTWRFYEHSQDLFGEDEVIVVALEADRAFDARMLEDVRFLSREFEKLPNVRRVDSLATVPVIRVDADGDLNLAAALDEPLRISAESARRIGSIVAGDRIAPRSLVSEDGRVAAINILLERDTEAHYPELVGKVSEILGGRQAWVSGVPVFRVATDARTREEVLLFVPITVVVVGLLLFAIFRRAAAVLIPLATSGVATWVLLAALGATGTPVTVTTAILPSIMLALGCAYVMHLLTAASEAGSRDRLEGSLAAVARPIAISGITTAVGFLAIANVPIDAIRFVGLFGAIGAGVLMLTSLTLAPAILALWSVSGAAPGPGLRVRRMGRWMVLQAAGARRRSVVTSWLVVLAVSAYGVHSLEVNTDVTRWFPESSPVRQSWDAIRERLSGLTPVNVILESQGESRLSDPEMLAAVDALTRFLDGLPEVGKAVSIGDPLRQLHGGFVDDPTMPLPLGRGLTEQYLLLLSSVEPLRDLVTDDRSAANVLLRVDNNGSQPIRRLSGKIDRWWSEHGLTRVTARTTGTMYVFAQAEDDIAFGQLKGLVYAVGGIGAVLLFVFRQPIVVGTVLVANVTPIVLLLGMMGLCGVPLDAGTVLVGSIALGIAVDDAIHVVSTYQAERGRGCEPVQAILISYERVLPPLVYTTLAISIGFAVLGLSPFTFTRNLGLLTTAVMVLCWLADVTLLPAILARLGRIPRDARAV